MTYACLRVSTDKQTAENQRHEILSHGYCVDKWFMDEGVSGTVDYHKRTLNKLLKELKEGDTLICSELSRLGRSLYMIFEILNFLTQKQIKLITIKEHFELDNSINSKVLSFAFGLSAEIERQLISDRTREALALRKAKGIKLGRRVGSVNKNSKLDPYKEKLIKWKQDGRSVYYMCKRLKVHRATIKKYLERI